MDTLAKIFAVYGDPMENKTEEKAYFVYMLRCEDGSLYTGITTDIKHRFKEHTSQSGKSAKYTLSHKAVKIETLWKAQNRIEASRLEYKLKALDKAQKEKLLSGEDTDKIDFSLYKRLSLSEIEQELK